MLTRETLGARDAVGALGVLAPRYEAPGGGGGGDDAASDAWTQMISPDSREIWWFNPVLELSSWSDPRTDPGATLYDARPT